MVRFVVDRLQYYSDALKPWIARRGRLGRFVLRRDPRDISRIWVLDPDGDAYVEVGYRTLRWPGRRSARGSRRPPSLGCVSWPRRDRRERTVRHSGEDARDHRCRGGRTRKPRRDCQRRAEAPPRPWHAPSPPKPPAGQTGPDEEAIAQSLEVIE
ncbi:Mu transposase C-terminal domain-containing protein [Streptomyces chartreusis]